MSSPATTSRTSSDSQIPAYPPTAHTHTTTSSRVVSEQPPPAPTMTTARGTVTNGEAERLRGGCIPCPDGGCCYIIPIPCCC
ncbi:hypothetical protein DFH08DRAFT_1079129 [Mycena albidolilacea]|uniref:Uncharacterized protein n=1 Tax=Mycena albidolilacea TaxID=1033008 RepID=A0AAD7A5F4_9AGAR|nr:hypothetical protein DFH08DRAFT_1079129 [Mycena albidolilacea]